VSGDRVAAIDCGTNSLRMLIADRDDSGQLIDVCRVGEIVRLGQGVDKTGLLDPQALERTRLALLTFADLIELHDAEAIRMVATSATRDAGNRQDFVDMVHAVLNVEPEVVSGVEEASLSFHGAVMGLPDLSGRALVTDIGGGSTELVLGPAGTSAATSELLQAFSMDIGCVRLTERHFHDDPPTAEQIAAAEADIRAALSEAVTHVPVTPEVTMVGVAGSVTTLAGIVMDMPAYDPVANHGFVLSRADVDRVAQQLLTATAAQRRAIPVMHPGRADIIAAGVLILRTLMDVYATNSIVISEHDILDGIAASIETS